MHLQQRQPGEYLVAGRKDFRPAQVIVPLPHLVGTGQQQLRDALAVGAEDVAIGLAHDVQHHPVVGPVAVVPVAQPVRGAVVHLHVARPERAAQLHLGVEEVGAGVRMGQAGVDDLQRLPVRGLQGAQGINAVSPDIMQQLFHRTVTLVYGCQR